LNRDLSTLATRTSSDLEASKLEEKQMILYAIKTNERTTNSKNNSIYRTIQKKFEKKKKSVKGCVPTMIPGKLIKFQLKGLGTLEMIM
jgi:hypothetical protein